MERAELIELIVETARDYAATLPDGAPKSMSAETALFGTGGIFDSIGLVSVIADLEDQLNDQLGTAITIADERALSAERSPFRSVGTLADHVLALLRPTG